MDRTQFALSVDYLTHSERAEQKNEHAPGEIREAALKRKTDGQACGTEYRYEGSGLDPYHPRDGNEQEDLEADARKAAQEAGKSDFDVLALEGRPRTPTRRLMIHMPTTSVMIASAKPGP